MTTNEREIAIREGHKIHAETSYFTPRPQLDFENARHVFCEGFDRGYISATTEANKRIAEIESEVAELNQSIEKLVELIAAGADLNESYRKTIDAYEKAHKADLEEKTQARHDEALAYKHYHELQAHNDILREALEENHYSNSSDKAIKLYNDAMYSTPAESLREQDDSDTERLNFLDKLQERATSDMKINMSLKSDIHINGSLGVSLYIRNYKGHTESTAYGKTIREAIDMALKEVK